MRPGTLGRAGDGPEIPHVGHPVEQHHERRLVFGHTFQNVGQLHILDGRGLRHGALEVAARQAVELVDRNLLIMQTVAHAKIFQLLHQLPFGALADVEFLDLLSGLDRFGHGTNPENKVAIHRVNCYICHFEHSEESKNQRQDPLCPDSSFLSIALFVPATIL